MSRFLRRAVLLLAVAGCAVGGFVVGWSTFGSGGLENFYVAALIGTACGLAIGIAIAAIIARLIDHRGQGSMCRQDSEVRSAR